MNSKSSALLALLIIIILIIIVAVYWSYGCCEPVCDKVCDKPCRRPCELARSPPSQCLSQKRERCSEILPDPWETHCN